jgi:diguanylate cyclase (GGDEF)-like protein
VSAKVLRTLLALAFPGGVLLLAATAMMHFEIVPEPAWEFLPYFAYLVFAVALVLSVMFNRSRVFFAMLTLVITDLTLRWIMPRMAAAGVDRIVFDALAFLLPLNLLALAFANDRGIVTGRGRLRLGFIGLQAIAVAVICLPQQAAAAALLQYSFIDPGVPEWSRVSQPALLSFVVGGTVLLVRLLKRHRPVESGLFWTLVAAFVALNAGSSMHLSSTYFATGGLILAIAVVETSYSMAYRDELTDLPSRRAMNETLLKLGDTYAIGMVDVDHFKQFNDTYGHATGDQVLRMVASKMAEVSGGKAFRYGGEEFAVIFAGMSVEEAFPKLQSLRQRIENSRFMVRGKDRRKSGGRPNGRKRETNVTVSIGVAASRPEENLTPEQIIKLADRALYQAKKSGRNCVMVS